MPRKVTIWLDCADGMQPVSKSAPLDKDYFDRCLTLTEAENKVNVGRSSSNVLNFKPESDNALFTSRVVSRSHAVLSADVTTGDVMVKDLGSVHGTWVNGRRVTPHFQQHLEAGDSLIFGQNIPHASHGYHEARTFRVSYWWGDIDNEDNKKSASNLIDETANPVLPPRPSGIRVPTTSSEDESEEQDYDEQSDIELLTVHTKTTKQHVPPTKKEDSGIVVLSESETESDDEVQVVSVTPNKKIIELDMDDLHNDDDDEEEMDLTWPALTTSTTSDQRLAAYTAPEGRTQNTGAQDSHELRLPGPTVYRNVEDLEKTQVASNELDKLATITPEESVSFLKSENENEEAGDDTQGLSTTQSTIASSTQTSGLPASIYPNLLTASTHPDSSTHTVSNHYRPPPFRIVQSRWDVGPTLAPTVAVNPYSQYVSSLYEASDVQTRAKEFQNGTHELKAIHDAAFSVEQNVSAPPAPTLPKCALVEQPSRVTVPADKSKMSIRNIIEPVSESGSPDPEVVAATQADLSTDQMEASTKMQTEAPATKQNIELTSSGSKKRKVDEVDHLFVEPLSQDSAYALHTSTNLAAKELDAEVLHSIRHKRPFIMETTHARIKSAVRARLAEKRATRGIEIKKTCNKTAWMASVKPFLLGTLVGSVGVFGALLNLPGME